MQWLIDLILEAARDVPRGRIWAGVYTLVFDRVWTKVLFTVTDYENKILCDLPNNRIVITESGYYLILSSVGLIDVSGGTRVHTLVYLNGDPEISYSTETVGAPDDPRQPSANVRFLTPGDFLELYVWQDHAPAAVTVNTNNSTYLAAHLLS